MRYLVAAEDSKSLALQDQLLGVRSVGLRFFGIRHLATPINSLPYSEKNYPCILRVLGLYTEWSR